MTSWVISTLFIIFGSPWVLSRVGKTHSSSNFPAHLKVKLSPEGTTCWSCRGCNLGAGYPAVMSSYTICPKQTLNSNTSRNIIFWHKIMLIFSILIIEEVCSYQFYHRSKLLSHFKWWVRYRQFFTICIAALYVSVKFWKNFHISQIFFFQFEHWMEFPK